MLPDAQGRHVEDNGKVVFEVDETTDPGAEAADELLQALSGDAEARRGKILILVEELKTYAGIGNARALEALSDSRIEKAGINTEIIVEVA